MSGDLRPTVEWTTIQGFSDDPVYDDAALSALCLKVGSPGDLNGKREALKYRLREITSAFAFNFWGEQQVDSAKVRQEAEALFHACSEVLRILSGLPKTPSRPKAKREVSLIALRERLDILFGPAVDAGVSESLLLPMFAAGGLFMADTKRDEPSGKAATLNMVRAVALLRENARTLYGVAGKHPARGAGRPETRSVKRLVAGLANLYWEIWEEEPGYWTDVHKAARGKFVTLMVAVTAAIQGRGLRFYATGESLAKVWDRLDPADKMRWSSIPKGSPRRPADNGLTK